MIDGRARAVQGDHWPTRFDTRNGSGLAPSPLPTPYSPALHARLALSSNPPDLDDMTSIPSYSPSRGGYAAYTAQRVQPTLLSIQPSHRAPQQHAPSPTSATSEPTRRAATPTQHIPEPHLPLRRGSSQRLRQRVASPPQSPLHQTEFQHPDPAPPTTRTSSALPRGLSIIPAKMEDVPKKDMPPPASAIMPAISTRQPYRRPSIPEGRPRGQSISSSAFPHSTGRRLRYSTSIPNLGELRSGHRYGPSTTYKPERGRPAAADTDSGYGSLRREPLMIRDMLADEGRSSYRSAWTTESSGFVDTSGTERSSIVTKRSSVSEIPSSATQDMESEDEEEEEEEEEEVEGMTTEDFIGMYAEGFEDDEPEEEEISHDVHEVSDEGYASQVNPRPSSDAPAEESFEPYRPVSPNKRVASVTPLEPESPPKKQVLQPPTHNHTRTSTQIFAGKTHSFCSTNFRDPEQSAPVPRDRYGFKKASHNISVEEYNKWDAQYTQYIERRRKKWHAMMNDHGLDTKKPYRFPPRSDKVKRFVRKGIPPEWRGAAWFWYSGGPERSAAHPGLYWELIEQVNEGKLSEVDRDLIERDLHRTFPDNNRFKPDTPMDPTDESGCPTPTRPCSSQETPILRALRRVLQAFAVHNPSIGYCQSLNFLAGLLLLFMDEDEEKTFIVLDIITTEYLPGTHGKILEANIDVGVLMTCIRDSMPAIWHKIDDQTNSDGFNPNKPASSRLPTVALTTTSWFMSLFVGNLPIETVLRVWDSLFYEGSKTLFRIALAIFKLGEPEIRQINDHMEIFQVVQAIPRKLVDANVLMEACFRRRNGFGHLSQETIDLKRAERRRMHAQDMARMTGGREMELHFAEMGKRSATEGLRKAASKAGFKRGKHRKKHRERA